MRANFFVLLMLSGSAVCGQNGNYFLSHFATPDDNAANVCFDLTQHPDGLMYFATRTGILEFDGRNWTTIEGTGPVYAVKVDSLGQVLWSGARGFGLIATDEFGQKHGEVRSPSGMKDVFQTLVTHKDVYFLSSDSLFICGDSLEVHKKIKSSSLTGSFTNVFEIADEIFVSTENGGLFQILDGSLSEASLETEAGDASIVARNGDRYLIVDGRNRVSVYDWSGNHHLELEDQQYAEASVIIAACWVDKDLIALGTLRGGLILADASTGKTREIINYGTGLPDNEIYAMMGDNSKSIWTAHERGFTRISPYLPFRSYNHYRGLQGNLLCAASLGTAVYVGTSLGLYRLEREETFEEIIYYVDVPITRQTAKKTESKTTNEVRDQTSNSRKKGFFHFLRKDRNKRTMEAAIVDDETVTAMIEKSADPLPATRRVKKTERILRSAQYAYEPVAGIEAKISKVIVSNGRLIAAGLGGVYEVKDRASIPITSDPARALFASRDGNLLFVSTYDNTIRTFARNNNRWEEIQLLSNLKDQISSVFQENSDIFWFCGLDNVYRLEIAGQHLRNIETIQFPNPDYDEVTGLNWDGIVTLVTSGGFFQYDKTNHTFKPLDSLAAPLSYFGGDKTIWYRDAHQWNELTPNGSLIRLPLLNLHRDIRFIAAEPDDHGLWIITAGNELFKFSNREFRPATDYNLSLKSIRNTGGKVSRKGKLRFLEDQSLATFELVQPDYLAPLAIEYRFQLLGLETKWSEWSTGNNIVNFPYLPPGDYTLNVQSRDIFGKVNSLEPLSFEVLPPYWKRTWFYAVEFAVFSLLVVLSLRFSTRYLVVSRLLSLLTIILLIQFIQTVAGEVFETRTSPVLDFFVQVVIALLILPFEGYLRGLLMGTSLSGPVLTGLSEVTSAKESENGGEP
jgi:WD40 repeat protein